MRLAGDILIAVGCFAWFGALVALNYWAGWRNREMDVVKEIAPDKVAAELERSLPDAAVRAGLAVLLVGVGLLVRFWT